MKSLKSQKRGSQVEISKLSFCSIHCRALKFFTHEELEPIMFTNFKQKVQNVCHTMLGVTFCVFFWPGGNTDMLINPQKPMAV